MHHVRVDGHAELNCCCARCRGVDGDRPDAGASHAATSDRRHRRVRATEAAELRHVEVIHDQSKLGGLIHIIGVVCGVVAADWRERIVICLQDWAAGVGIAQPQSECVSLTSVPDCANDRLWRGVL